MKEKKLRKLIKRAMGDVEVIRCPRCRGRGARGLLLAADQGDPSLREVCPRCGGCGQSTNGANISGAGVSS